MKARDEPTLFSVAAQAAKNAAPVRPLLPWHQRARLVLRSGWFVRSVLSVLLVSALGVGGWLGWPHRAAALAWMDVQLAKATGAVVAKIEVTGAQWSSREALEGALALRRGQGLVTYDTFGARTRLEQLPWVAKAQVSRQLPDTLKVELTEHVPLARMDVDGAMWVLNDRGAKVVEDVNGTWEHLPMVAGEGAAAEVAALMELLRPWPNLIGNLKQATWVGGRRWDVTFASGVLVQLPAAGGDAGYDAAAALKTLAELEAARHVLTLPDGVVDLRLADRITMRLPETVGATPVTTAPVGAATKTSLTTTKQG